MNTVVEAYIDHQALVIRLGNILLAILAQLRTELVQRQLVAHEEHKALKIHVMGPRHAVHFAVGDL